MPKNKQQNSPKNEKFFSMDNIVGIIAFAVVILVALYVISTHFNMPTIIVPDDAVEITYPESIFTGNVDEIADSMSGTEGTYRVKVNKDNSLTVKMSPERYESIKEAAKNNLESLMLLSIGEETAVREYKANEDKTVFNITVIPEHESLDEEISNALYSVRLYHICNMNNDVKITFYYIDQTNTDVAYKCETYDMEGNVVETATGSVAYPVIDEATE